MKNIAIIPARSGSKGLKDKNIKLLNGKPLLYYSINVAIKSKMFDEIMVSTDSQKYADIAMSFGASVPFLRNDLLSNDNASSWDVVKDVILHYKKIGKTFDTATLLQPTSPLRTAEDIKNGYKIMQEKNANLVTGVCEMDHSPLWSNTLPHDNSMENFINPSVVKIPRQEIPTYYRINGALYIIKISHLFSVSDIYSDKSYAHIMPKMHSIDIDDIFDFKLASILMNDSIQSN